MGTIASRLIWNLTGGAAVDGGATRGDFLTRFQSDILGIPNVTQEAQEFLVSMTGHVLRQHLPLAMSSARLICRFRAPTEARLT